MTNYEVDVVYAERVYDTVLIQDVEDTAEAEFEARNHILDSNPELSAASVEVLEVRPVG